MFKSQDYMNGYYDGQNNSNSNFYTQKVINQLKHDNRRLVKDNHSLQNDINNLLNDRERLKEGFLKVAEQRDALGN